MGYLLVYGEVVDKCILEKKTADSAMKQIATMSMKKGRATLDCKLFSSSRRSSGPTLQIDTFVVELNMQLLHRRLGHFGIDAMRKLMSGKLVRGVDNIKVENLRPCEFCKQGKLPQGPHPVANVSNKGTRLLDLVVVDLAGPNRPQTLGKKL